jgi:hypothetical protein
MNWDESYQKGEVFWDKGAPPLREQLWLARADESARLRTT